MAKKLTPKGGDTGTEDADTGAPAFGNGTLLVGVFCALVALVVIVFALRLLLPDTNTDYAMLPNGYREATGLDTGAPMATSTPMPGQVSAPRSPFPRPVSQAPIIINVECPDGTVEIITGDHAADTVCIEGTLGGAAMATPAPIIIIQGSDQGASIGGTDVPALDCAEDEVISFTAPDVLACVHYENVAPD